MKHLIKQKGVGLIEVLTTTLVVAIGLLAVASLQGTLMKDSGSNKANNEAMQLANQKMEQLRDQIELTGYNAITSARETTVIAGSNESFFRYWLIDTLGSGTTVTAGDTLQCGGVATAADIAGPARKRICVNVVWPYSTVPTSNPTTPDPNKLVTVQSIIAFDNVSYSSMLSDAAENPTNLNIGSPTTNAGSSTVIADSKNTPITGGTAGTVTSTSPNTEGQYLKANTGGTTAAVVYKCTGETATSVVPFVHFVGNLYIRRVNNQSAFPAFKEAIELAQGNNDAATNGLGVDTCTREVRYNGGVMIPIKGRIYSNVSSSSIPALLGFDASESGVFCQINYTGLSTSTSVPYTCYVGGNCVNGPVGTHKADATTAIAGDDTVATECPSLPAGTFTATPIYPANVYASVGAGGWRGNVGVIGLANQQASNTLTTCFSTIATARQYYSLRTVSTVKTNEGINKPFLCHDFLIVDPPNGNNTTQDCTSASVVGALKLADNPIRRGFPYTDNLHTTGTAGTTATTLNAFDPVVDASHCHSITGTFTGNPTGVTASTTNGGFDCTLSGSTYTCIGSTKSTSVTIAAVGATGSCTVSGLVNTNMTPAGCTLATSGSTATTYMLTTSVGTGGASISPATGTQAVNAAVTVQATASSGFALSGWAVTGTGATTCTGTTNPCSVTMGSDRSVAASFASTGTITTHTINGTVTNVMSSTTVTAVSSAGVVTSCSGYPTYACTVPDGWTGEVRVTGTCTTGTLTPSATTRAFTNVTTDLNSQDITLTCTAASTTHTISGLISTTGTLTNLTVANPAGGSCSVSTTSPYAYECLLVPNTWSGNLTANGNCSGTLSATAVAFGTSIVNQTGDLPISCSAATSFTVPGTISSGANKVTLPSGCTPTSFNGSSGNFTCTVAAGASLTVTPDSGYNVCVGEANAGTAKNPIVTNVTSNVTLLNFYVKNQACP